MSQVSVVVVNWNGGDLLPSCLDPLVLTRGRHRPGDQIEATGTDEDVEMSSGDGSASE